MGSATDIVLFKWHDNVQHSSQWKGNFIADIERLRSCFIMAKPRAKKQPSGSVVLK